MKLEVSRAGTVSISEGRAARAIVKEVLHAIGQSILIPEPPYTGIVRRRVVETLRNGRPVWTKSDEVGQADRSGLIIMVKRDIKIVGIIRKDGTWDGEGPDPRLAPEAGALEQEPAQNPSVQQGTADPDGSKSGV